MDSGFYAACAGLRAQSQALEVAAHNLANLNTVGFRGQQASFQSLLAVARPTVPNALNLATNNFGVLEGTHLDLSAGSLENTGNPLALGIEGSGFFVIQTARGRRYTRNGNFRVARSGELVTAAGDPVLGTPGGSEGLGQIEQGYLEQSNVSVVDEFIQMIVAQRSYEANSRVVRAADEMFQLVNNLGR